MDNVLTEINREDSSRSVDSEFEMVEHKEPITMGRRFGVESSSSPI